MKFKPDFSIQLIASAFFSFFVSAALWAAPRPQDGPIPSHATAIDATSVAPLSELLSEVFPDVWINETPWSLPVEINGQVSFARPGAVITGHIGRQFCSIRCAANECAVCGPVLLGCYAYCAPSHSGKGCASYCEIGNPGPGGAPSTIEPADMDDDKDLE